MSDKSKLNFSLIFKNDEYDGDEIKCDEFYVMDDICGNGVVLNEFENNIELNENKDELNLTQDLNTENQSPPQEQSPIHVTNPKAFVKYKTGLVTMNDVALNEDKKKKNKKDTKNKDDSEDQDIINYIDKAIYCIIRKYAGKSNFTRTLSLDRLSEESGFTRPTLNKILKKLEDKKLIKVHKTFKPYSYEILNPNFKKFEMISYTLLELHIPFKLKAFCIAIQEFLTNKETGIGTCMITNNSQLAKLLGMSYKQYNKLLKQCREEGIIINNIDSYNTLKDLKDHPLQFDLKSLGQAILFVNDKVDLNIKETLVLKDQMEIMQEEIKMLKEQLNKQQLSTKS